MGLILFDYFSNAFGTRIILHNGKKFIDSWMISLEYLLNIKQQLL